MTLLAQSNAFPDLDLSTDLATAAQQHRDTRREVLRQLVLNSAKPLVPALLRILRSETVRDPYDGWIPYTAALAHARAGDTTGALAIIDLVETETRDRLTKEPRPEFKELRLDLTRGLYNLAVPSVQTGIDGPSPLPRQPDSRKANRGWAPANCADPRHGFESARSRPPGAPSSGVRLSRRWQDTVLGWGSGRLARARV